MMDKTWTRAQAAVNECDIPFASIDSLIRTMDARDRADIDCEHDDLLSLMARQQAWVRQPLREAGCLKF